MSGTPILPTSITKENTCSLSKQSSSNHWLSYLAFLILPVILFPDVVFGGARFISRDLLHYFYPLGEIIRRAFLGEGSFLWDSAIDHGLPLAARWSPAIFYPAHW